jgi:hypothetical protein
MYDKKGEEVESANNCEPGDDHPAACNWDEDRTPFRPKLVLRADSFRPKLLFDTTCRRKRGPTAF